MKARCLLVISVAVCAMIAGCGKSRGAMQTAFGESTGRGVPEIVQYYDDAAAALDQHLNSINFSATTKPTNASKGGATFVAQRDSLYEGTFRNSDAVHVLVRQPTAHATGLHVYIVWQVEGSSAYVDAGEKNGEALCKELAQWWKEYKRKNPRSSVVK